MAATVDSVGPGRRVQTGSYGDVQPSRTVKPIEIPAGVRMPMDRGRERMKEKASRRRLCIRFARGESWWWLDSRDGMNLTPHVTDQRGGKPPHKQRNQYNFIAPIVEDKVSTATQRIPSYEIDPATTDPEDAGAAKLSEKVAIYGYDKWDYRHMAIDAVKTAIAHGGSSYTLIYWEPNVGPYKQVGDRWVGDGEVRWHVFDGNSVYWEDGAKYEDSRWWAVERAKLIDEIYLMPGYAGGELIADASTSDIPTDRRPGERMCVMTDYFERPCPKYPQGRWLTIANGRVIIDARKLEDYEQETDEFWQEYPVRDVDGAVVDEPVLDRLVYTHDPDNDDDLGLTWALIDFQRSAQDCINKMLEYKNRGLNLQMLAPVNSIISPPDDVPNSVRYYKLSPNGEKPDWEQPPSGQILNALQQIFNLILTQMNRVASYEDVQAQPNVAARTTQAVIEQSNARWQTFIGDLAVWHSKTMRRGLNFVARYYNEPRTLDIRGRMGWESIPDFKGAKLLGQTNVRVFVQSLDYLTKNQIMARVQYYAQMGWVNGTQAMSAIEGGITEKLSESYEQDVARVERIIAKIRDGTVMEMPKRLDFVNQTVPGQAVTDPATGAPILDPATGQPQTGPPTTRVVPMEVPMWMPADYDSIPVWRQRLGTWLKTQDFEQTPPPMQEVAKNMWAGLDVKEQEKAIQKAQMEQATAQQIGMGNASNPALQPGGAGAAMPSLPNAAGMPASGALQPGGGPGSGAQAGQSVTP